MSGCFFFLCFCIGVVFSIQCSSCCVSSFSILFTGCFFFFFVYFTICFFFIFTSTTYKDCLTCFLIFRPLEFWISILMSGCFFCCQYFCIFEFFIFKSTSSRISCLFILFTTYILCHIRSNIAWNPLFILSVFIFKHCGTA